MKKETYNIDIARVIYKDYAEKKIASKETLQCKQRYDELARDLQNKLNYPQKKQFDATEDAFHVFFASYEIDIIRYVLQFVKTLFK